MSPNHNRLATNREKADAAWSPEVPAWVKLLADACDRDGQARTATRLGYSGGTISRILRRVYPGDLDEAEKLVRAAYGAEQVACPLWGTLPLANCIHLRRRKRPPQNQLHHACARTCPTCPNNTDRPSEED